MERDVRVPALELGTRARGSHIPHGASIGNAIRDLAVKMRHLRFVIYDVQRCPVEESRWPIPQFHFGNWFILWGWLETTLLDDPNIRPGMDDNASFDRG